MFFQYIIKLLESIILFHLLTMTLINTLNSYSNSDIDNTDYILRNIHKTYSANELRFVLTMPKYREIYHKIKTNAYINQGLNILPFCL
jgi:hypothetical protein